MSTGLTYVTFLDSASTDPQQGSFIQVFSSYDEAYKYGDWLVRLISLQTTGSVAANVAIWTTSPNLNGYWYFNGTAASFAPFE
jgi:hypothetical protein